MTHRPSADDRARPCAVYVASTSVHLARTRLPLMRAMQRAGWRVLAVAPADAHAARLRDAGIEWLAQPIAREIATPIRHARLYRALHRLYRDVRPALVHHLTANPVIYGSLAAHRAGVPAVVNALPGRGSVFASRRWDAPPLRAFLRAAYGIVSRLPNSRLIFQNRDDHAAFVGGIVPPARAVLIRGSGIDLDRFRPTPEPAGPPVVLFCGRLLASKGVHELVAAARLLRAWRVPHRVRLVGRLDAGHRDAIPEAAVRGWIAEGLVEWDGQRDDVWTAYAAAHVVALPSYGEGVPRVLVEGAACARPLVATDVPGCREIVVPGRTGLLVPPRDPAPLAAALARLLRAPAERAAFGRAGRALVAATLGQDAVIAATVAVYRTLVDPALPLPGEAPAPAWPADAPPAALIGV